MGWLGVLIDREFFLMMNNDEGAEPKPCLLCVKVAATGI